MRVMVNWFKGIRINKVVQFLTYSDLMIYTGWGLISPIMAVFFTENIEGGSVALAGLAATVYFVTKSIFQVPVARFIDARKGEKDDLVVMVIGNLLITLAAFLYIFIHLPWQVMVAQVIYGIGGAFSFPAWLAIFSRHLDKREEGLEWSVYYTATDVGAALSAGLGGLLVARYGFSFLFGVVAITNLIGTTFLWGVVNKVRKS